MVSVMFLRLKDGERELKGLFMPAFGGAEKIGFR